MKSPRAYFMIRQNGLNYIEYNHSSKLCLVILTTQESVSSEQTGQGKGKKGKTESLLVSKQLGEHFSGLFVKQQQPQGTTQHIPRFQKWICVVGTWMGRQQINPPTGDGTASWDTATRCTTAPHCRAAFFARGHRSACAEARPGVNVLTKLGGNSYSALRLFARKREENKLQALKAGSQSCCFVWQLSEQYHRKHRKVN